MSKPYSVGLVVGKFAPLHEGHVLVFERAASLCARVIVISYSNPEPPGYEAARREGWLRECLPSATVLVVTPERLADWLGHREVPGIPGNDATDDSQREFVAMLCDRVLKARPDAVFTSEAYGDGFARHLTEAFRRARPDGPAVEHVVVDRERRVVPVSGTALRANLWRHWQHLPQHVARSLVRRVVFLGGESSGKTVLASRLARELEAACAPEYGRELWEARSGRLEYPDMVRIAREQIAREASAAGSARAFVFCDTSPLTTLFYSQEMFGRAEPELELAAQRPYDSVILCAPDFPFVQDGTRRDDAFRRQQHAWYESELAARGVAYVLVRGSLETRIALVRGLLGL
jgi:HTH-type transcriptional repressor of NAD biosynthesis genes